MQIWPFTAGDHLLNVTVREKFNGILKVWFGLRCLTLLSTIFHLYRGSQFYWQMKLKYLEKTTDLLQVTDKLYSVISCQSVLLADETEVPGENHRPAASHWQTLFSYIVSVSFIGGGNWSTQRKPPTCYKSLTNFITKCCIEYTSPHHEWGSNSQL